uniref:Uncharacterized protein n=1 Tax=Anguilla anguilla TaxID=7936 RepID=A0A0E9TWG7_ANGAN
MAYATCIRECTCQEHVMKPIAALVQYVVSKRVYNIWPNCII